jgi:hypothetical protein
MVRRSFHHTFICSRPECRVLPLKHG